MNITELEILYTTQKQCDAGTPNELLDFARKLYLSQSITIRNYQQLAKTLEGLGACIPEDSTDQKSILS